MKNLYEYLKKLEEKPALFCQYTAETLWNDKYISSKMLEYHLNQSTDLASRRVSQIEESVSFIIDAFKLKKGDKLIDFGCGPGFYTTRFALAGLTVTGIDLSENSIEYGKKTAIDRKLAIDYHCQNYLKKISVQDQDIATLIYCDYCPLSKEQRQTLLFNIAGTLRKEGFFFFDVFTENAYYLRESITRFGKNLMNKFWSEEDYYCFANSFSYDEEKVFLDRYTIISEEKIFEVYNWLTYFRLEQIKEELSSSGFEIVGVYGDATGKKYEKTQELMAFACVKK